METYPRTAVERAMKILEVILRAVAKKITWAGGRDSAFILFAAEIKDLSLGVKSQKPNNSD